MMRRFLLLLWLAAAAAVAQRQDKVAPVAAMGAEPFALEEVRLFDGPFRHAMLLDQAYLLSLDPDRLLHSFRLNAGLPSVAKPYGGWMTPGHTGCAEFVGHYMSACALMYASTGDATLRQRVGEVVTGLAQCQEKLGTGYLHTKPDRFTTLGEAPLGLWYQIHKLMAGLMEVYVHCDNPLALQVARKMGDWAKASTDRRTDAQMQKMLEVEHGGINEALANLSALTGERKYLDLALRFNHREVIGPASRRIDNLDGKHANTQIPKFIGAAREYELTGRDDLKTAATFFWDDVVHDRTYVNGGNSLGEMFTPKAKLSDALGPNTCETCNTYNMLKLTRHLFCLQPRAEYADYYERALYNHILASQNPTSGMMVYFLPLQFGAKEYCTPENTFWCCTGTGVENHAKYGGSIYFHQGPTNLYVNLFIASELRWAGVGIILRQNTKFPDEGRTQLSFRCNQPTKLRLNIRHPYWATDGFEIRVNGVMVTDESTPGSYASIDRTWNNNDIVEVTMPFSLRTEGFRDNPNRRAVMYGPLVLCAESEASKRSDELYPVIIGKPGRWTDGLAPGPGRPGTFRAPANFKLTSGAGAGARLEPLYAMHGNRRYIVYWNTFAAAEWQTNEAGAAALQRRTVDRVYPGDEESEREHGLSLRNSGTDGRNWRDAWDGGWFSWRLKVRTGMPHELRVKYWGGDSGGREFDVLVDDAKVATVKLENNRPGQYYEESYPISAEMTGGKTNVTVMFKGHPGRMAGGVFGCALLTTDDAQAR